MDMSLDERIAASNVSSAPAHNKTTPVDESICRAEGVAGLVPVVEASGRISVAAAIIVSIVPLRWACMTSLLRFPLTLAFAQVFIHFSLPFIEVRHCSTGWLRLVIIGPQSDLRVVT